MLLVLLVLWSQAVIPEAHADPAPRALPPVAQTAPTPASVASPLRFRRLTADDGLPASTIHHVMQDRRGFIWISTRRGVLRYDGRSYNIFQQDPLDANSLSANTVWVTAEDRRGWIWIGTLGGGLTIYRPTSGRFVRVQADTTDPTALQANTVTALHEDAQGRMWVGTDGGGLSLARVSRAGAADSVQVSFRTIRQTDASGPSLTNDRILDIAETPSGALWLATYGGGVNRYDPATNSVMAVRHDPSITSSLSDNYVMSVALDDDGGLWVGTKYGGLNYVEPSGEVTRVPVSIRGTAIEFVWRTRLIDGVLWVGTYGRGLARLTYRREDGGVRLTSVDTAVHDPSNPHSLSDDFVLAIFQDRTGTVWCGTDNDGLNLFYDAPYARPLDGTLGSGGRPLRNATITEVHDWNEHLWLGTTQGLFARSTSPASFDSLPIPDSSALISDLQPGRNGWLWICTNHGLYRYHPDRDRLVALFPQIRSQIPTANDRFFDIIVQRDGTVWAGTDRGILRLEVEGETVVSARRAADVNRQLASERIRHLARHRDTTWIGMTDGGLARVATMTGEARSLASLTGMPMYETMKVLDMARVGSTLWVATHGGGVVRLRGDASRVYTDADGLPSTIIRSVATDTLGAVWVTTDAGLARKRPGDDRFRRIPLPVPGVEGVGSVFEVGDDRLFVTGSDRDVLSIDPAAMHTRPAASPAVAVANVQVMGQSVQGERGLTPWRGTGGDERSSRLPTLRLAPDEDFVTVEFAVLDFAWPSANRLEYRLDGRHQTWQPLGESGAVSFSNLAPGRYVLEARGAGLSGEWSADTAHLVLRVAPTVWETTAFQLLIGGLLLAFLAGGGLWRYRVYRRTQNRLETTRRRIADDLHDDLGSKISSVALMLDVAQQNVDDRAVPLLQDASETVREASRDLRDVVWIVDGTHDTLAAFLHHVRTVASRLSPRRPIQIEPPAQADAVVLTIEQRRHLLLFVKEALHNAVRHAAADAITVSCRLDADHLHLAVRDDGIGFDEQGVEGGRGLRTMEHRAEALDGTFSLQTQPNRGTTVSLTAPLA